MSDFNPFELAAGLVSLIVFAVTIYWIYRLIFRKQSAFSVYLVFQKCAVNEAATDGVFVDLVGRKGGFSNWLLTTLRLGTQTTMQVTDTRFLVRDASLSRETQFTVPLATVASTECSYVRNIWLLIWAAASMLGSFNFAVFAGDITLLLGGMLWGGILLFVFYISKVLMITVESNGGKTCSIKFKPSVIERVSVDMDFALQIIKIINDKAIHATARRQPLEQAAQEEPAFEHAPEPVAQIQCGNCGASFDQQMKGQYCDQCGGRLS